MRPKSSFLSVAWILLAAVVPSLANAEPRIEFEVLTGEGVPPSSSQRWAAALGGMNLGSVRIRAARPGDKTEIEKRGSGSSATYKVVGILTASNMLSVPGAQFRLGDKSGLSKWLDQVKLGGDGTKTPPAAFGLSADDLVAVHEALSTPITVQTKGKRPFDALREISRSLPLSFTAAGSAQQAMASDTLITDELRGLSGGTAMAAILRPLGLVMAPRRQSNGDIKLLIADVRQLPESWPVGWPPEKSPKDTLPNLFNFLNVAIDDRPLAEGLEAISGRLDAPILYDHNSLARQQIDPSTVKVTLPEGRSYYKGIIDRLVNQAKLKSELRVDEAGKAFLWISTLRR